MPKRKTQEEFIKEVQEKFNGEYEVLGQYINNREKILIKHNKCGNTFLKIPKDMVNKSSGCPYCFGNKNKLYNEEWVINNTPKPYHYIKGYAKMSEKCIFHCDNCNTDFLQSPSRLINEKIYGCDCRPTKRKTNEDFLNSLKKETLKEYDFLEEYTNIDTPILIKHKKCDTEFRLSPYKFIYRNNEKYCPICYYKKSKGEIIITQFLEENNIIYNKEYSFKDLTNLRFDFYLPKYNCCIEFDGKQHFEAIQHFGGEKAFLETQKRDYLKNQYCINNHITLYRIPYTEFENIKTILEQILKEKSSETIEKYKIY